MAKPYTYSNTVVRLEVYDGSHIELTELDTGRRHVIKEGEDGKAFVESFYKSGTRVAEPEPVPEPGSEPEPDKPAPEPVKEPGFLGLEK